MRIKPELVTVWNEDQRDEAVGYHRIGRDRIVVTGAPPFDRWFGRKPSRDRETFCRLIGLPSDRQFVLFVGSTKSISKPDAESVFVRHYVGELRKALDRLGLKVSILFRPHPFNQGHWASVDFNDLENVVIYPRHAANPVDESDRADYFDSLYHSTAVVGINTSAMIEAAIVGRTVHTVLDPAFATTQEGTLHFRYLLPENGGFLHVAKSLEEHAAQLAETLQHPDADAARLEAFVRRFVRPLGLTTPATPMLADTLETVVKRGSVPEEHVPAHLLPMTAVLSFAGFVSDPHTAKSLRSTARSMRKGWRNASKLPARWSRTARQIVRRSGPADPGDR
jgi:hypothetical protein